eukprot:m.56338 g.56338  ORF g.56338 m.56338 type:complete len:132 (-) comp11187_c0_seq4:778-1173(-)
MYAYRSMTITHTTQQTHTNENILIFFNTFIDNAHLLKRNVNVSELVNSEVTVVDVPINENIVIFWENSLRDLIGPILTQHLSIGGDLIDYDSPHFIDLPNYTKGHALVVFSAIGSLMLSDFLYLHSFIATY